MKIILATLAAAGIALSSGAALAQTTGAIGPIETFEGVDTDDNGLVSWAEFALVYSDVTEEQFRIADADGDTFLSAEEFDSLVISTGSVDTLPAPAAPEALDMNSLTYSPE
jgi:hypothetical protein